jgi:hypothetical protein
MTLPQVSRFWLDYAAGKPLGPRWARKDAQIALHDRAQLDELSEPAWMCIGEREQRQLLRDAVWVVE